MAKIKLIFIIISISIFNIFPDNAQNYSFTRKIEWKDNIIFYSDNHKKELLSFENAVYNDNTTDLPYYFELIKINNSTSDFNVILDEKVFSELSSEQLKSIKYLDVLNNDIKVNYDIKFYRKSPFLSISFIPLRKNAVTGKIEKLISFKMLITQKPVLKKMSESQLKSWQSSSVLSSGYWYKIKIKESGIYKISFNELIKMGFSNPENIRVFGNGGANLPLMNSEPCTDDLIENAIYVDNNNKYILFYAQGTQSWKYDSVKKIFTHVLNPFTDTAAYFLTTDAGIGKRISKVTNSDIPFNYTSTSFDELAFHELNDTNLLRSGRTWYGEVFSTFTKFDFNFNFSDRIINENCKIYIKVTGNSSSNSYYNVSLNDVNIGLIPIKSITGKFDTDSIVRSNFAIFNTTTNNKNIKLTLEYIKNPSGFGFLDFIDINVRSNLSFNRSQMFFRDIRTINENAVTKFIISNTNETLKVWDITDIYNVTEMELSGNSTQKSFICKTDKLKTFIAFDLSDCYTPTFSGKVENQNLHMPEKIDMVIVYPDEFKESASKLADFHKKNGLKVKLAKQEEIFNEFSSGQSDPAAIRNYMKMLYDRTNDIENEVKYLLLFGDGSYDYRSKTNNFIIVYESENSVDEDESYVSDDFFGLLDDYEGEGNGLLDIGIGRFPVSDRQGADNMVNKVIKYCSTDNLGDWQTNICFIGDDEDNNLHMIQSDSLARYYIERNYPYLNIEKIYLDAFVQEKSAIGDRYPAAVKSINNIINRGALIINYTGHGGEYGLAHERVIVNDYINAWNNIDKLPLFITATCEFSRFDDKNLKTAGENIILNPKGGGIAMLTTTRVVYSGDNFVLNSNFYKYAFSKNIAGENYALGDIIALTKNASGSNTNKLNFTLLGDPALKLKYPSYQILTDSINSIEINSFADTLKAFDKVVVSGHIADMSGNLLDNFSGVVVPKIFDKQKLVKTLNNDGNGVFTFYTQNNIIYKGLASVNNGFFRFSFIIPKDISYNFGKGKISYYAHNNKEFAVGYYNKFIIGGTSKNVLADSTGPEIELYMNDKNFISGGLTDKNPAIFAVISDSSGINTVGNGIGHDITAVIDDSSKYFYILNDFYQSKLNSYTSGTIKYQLNNISSGKHILKLKVWDILNNSSEEMIEFIVEDSAQLALKRIFNYPNPFTEKTSFYIEQNHANTEMEVMVQIFTVSGKLVKTLNTTLIPNGYLIGPIDWDGTDDFGDKIGRGVYFYRVRIRTESGKTIEKFEKLVILK